MKAYVALRPAAIALGLGVIAILSHSGTAHAITDAVFRYSTVQTGNLAIPSTAFGPLGSDNQYVYDSGRSALRLQTTDFACYAAPVNLPRGANMTTINVWYTNLGGTASVKLLKRINSSVAPEELADRPLTQTADINSVFQVAKSITAAGAVIDNIRNSYWVQFCGQNSQNILLYSVRITYTYGNAGD